MIKDRNQQVTRVANVITHRIAKINEVYRSGPSLYFYGRVRQLRSQYADIHAFVESHECIEILYATLVAWDMNSRGAKMMDFGEFWQNLRGQLSQLQIIEATLTTFTWQNRKGAVQALGALYESLHLMKSDGRLVSLSKCCHFMFPSLCMPMDRTNTLQNIYGNTNESQNKFVELLEFSYDVLAEVESPHQYLDDQWNTSEPKLVDNAIILLMADAQNRTGSGHDSLPRLGRA